MLRIQLDVNGRVIGEIGVHNEGTYEDHQKNIYGVYDLREASHGDSLGDHERVAQVAHDPDDGAAVLARLVMDQIGDEYFYEQQ